MAFYSNALNFPNLTTKGTPVSGDLLLIADSAAGNLPKQCTIGSLPSSGGSGTVTTYISFAGSATPTNNSSLNVSSITNSGTGIFTINYTSNFANTNYKLTATCGASARVGDTVDWTAKAVGSCGIATGTSSAAFNCTNNAVTIIP